MKLKSIKISKYLAKYLRHEPERLGLTLQVGGWVEVNDLLEAAASNGFHITINELREVVETNDKKRFAFNEDESLIRANQGHSTKVEMNFKNVQAS